MKSSLGSITKAAILFGLANLLCINPAQAQTANSVALPDGFASPPNSARPRVWWHWMNGNITKDGIRKDLSWMKQVGIGGAQNFDASLGTPQIVKDRLIFMTPAWKDAFRYATRVADSLQLELAIAGSPGWSVTGGPWVEPADGMKKYVWTETLVQGGRTFSGKLTEPSHATGKIQDHETATSSIMGGPRDPLPTFYADAAVVAFKLPSNEKTAASLNPKISSSGGTFSLASLTDGNLMKSIELPPGKIDDEIWIQYTFDAPQTVKAFTVSGAYHSPLEDFTGGPHNRSLKVSDDGVQFREVAAMTGSIVSLNTVSIPPTTSKYFRLVYKTLPGAGNPFAAMMGGPAGEQKPEGVQVSEFVLHLSDRIDQVEDKAGFTPWWENTPFKSPPYTDKENITVITDLTSRMKPDGTLVWDVPAGNWCILRFGYSLTGRQNHPASGEATGLEVDKLDKAAVTRYMEKYLDMYKDASGGLMGAKGLSHMILDSYEAGHMTWTKTFPEEFKKRRGYEIMNWLPVLTGRVVRSGAESEEFLWDFRKTIGELIAESHYDAIGDILHRRGMKRYTESHEGGRIYLADGMDVKRNADIPMSAMWTPGSLAPGPDEEIRSRADIRESASVAHIYGQNIVAAESLTAIRNTFGFSPERLKRTADMELASGVNRFVIHTSVHQPLDDKQPGLGLGPFGQWFTRHETWAGQARPWIDYLSRSSYMLQQGKCVADILYYYGENNNITQLFTGALPALPRGYEYDFVNASALKDVISAKDGKLVSPAGMSYSILVLDGSAKMMTVPVLRKIRELAKAGIGVVGARPLGSPSLADSDTDFQALVSEIWALPNVSTGPVEQFLKGKGIAEDVIVQGAASEILYVHRHADDREIYWLNNRSEKGTGATISFRVTGKAPELWNPLTGETEKISYEIKDGRTVVSLQFESWDALFIVFSGTTNALSFKKPEVKERQTLAIQGSWQLTFQAGRGAPASAEMTTLQSFTENADPGIKYFSGTATYKINFTSPLAGRGYIDLGDVKDVAEVFLNGKSQGIAWKAPFTLKLKDELKKGENSLEVRVTNLWVNRLIGDVQPGVTNKITYTTMPFYRADSPLLPSGLMGPGSIRVY